MTPVPKIISPLLEHLDDNLHHAFFTRDGGVSGGFYSSLNCGYGSNDNPIHITENRRRACEALDTSLESLVTPFQVHGTTVRIVDGPRNRLTTPEADGLVTRNPGIALGILTADCAPVLFADPHAGVIGACHAGWRGALKGIVESTLIAMENLGAGRDRICASIGPCIAQTSYQVGSEFRDQFLRVNSVNSHWFQEDEASRYRFDLSGFISERLAVAGVDAYDCIGRDNCAEEETLFSYRRSTHKKEPDFGRGLTAIMLSEK